MSNDVAATVIPGHSALTRARQISQNILSSMPQIRNHLVMQHSSLLIQKIKQPVQNEEINDDKAQKMVIEKIKQLFRAREEGERLKEEREKYNQWVVLMEGEKRRSKQEIQNDIKSRNGLLKSQSARDINIKAEQILKLAEDYSNQQRNKATTFRQTLTSNLQKKFDNDINEFENQFPPPTEHLNKKIFETNQRKYQLLESNVQMRERSKLLKIKLALIESENKGLREMIERQAYSNYIINQKYSKIVNQKKSDCSPTQKNNKNVVNGVKIEVVKKLQKIVQNTRMERVRINKQKEQEMIFKQNLLLWVQTGIQQSDQNARVFQAIKTNGFPNRVPDQFIQTHPKIEVIISQKKKSSSCNRLEAKQPNFYRTQSVKAFIKPFQQVNSPRRIGLLQQNQRISLTRMQVKRMLTPF